MKSIVIDNISNKPDLDSIAKKLHVEPDSDEYGELCTVLEEASEHIKPKAVYKPVFIEKSCTDHVVFDGVEMRSTVMPGNLKGLHRVFAFVATCGPEIEQYSKTVTDILHNWWMNTIMEDALHQASAVLRQHIKKSYDIRKIASMSPGSLPDWPITEQPKLFSLLGDVKKLAGVTLTDSMLMIPAKSVSGIYFETDTDYINCQLCTRNNCPGRKRPFDEKKYNDAFGG